VFKIEQTAGGHGPHTSKWDRLSLVAVRYYNFALDNGSGPDDLGGMALADDAEAIAFGKQVIQDLKGFQNLQSSVDHQYARWSLHVTEAERIVETIPFDVGH
jgi:hypothetical protein